VLLGLGASAETDLDSRPSHHDGEDDHDHDDFDSIVVEPGPIEEPVAYRRHLAEVARRYGILRLKGFLSVPGRPRRYALQGVGERLDGYYDRPWAASETPTSRLVIIAEHDADWAGLRQAVTGETLAA
jgi:cobalamin biosynthesis protein CobW